MPEPTQPTTTVAGVQLLFSEQLEGVLVLDMVALDALTWATGHLAPSSPFTVAVVVPREHDLREITERWASACEVLEMTLIDTASSEMVFLEGPDEQLLFELPKGHLAGGKD